MLLPDAVAVVTGGAAGIGGGISRRLAAEGATVVVNDIDPVLLAALENAILAAGGAVHTVPGDIRDPVVVDALAARALGVADERVDVLVNNVGDFRPNGRFLTTGPE